MRYLLILLLLLCSSCTQIFNDPEPVHYYLLESLPDGTEIISDKSLAIDLQISGFPTYIDRAQVTERNHDNTIKFSYVDRWAEPLQENILQTLRENLTALLPGAKISIGPWENPIARAMKVELRVKRFSGRLGDRTDVDIHWTILQNDETVGEGLLIDQQPIGATYQELVAGLNIGINNLSLELAKQLAEQ